MLLHFCTCWIIISGHFLYPIPGFGPFADNKFIVRDQILTDSLQEKNAPLQKTEEVLLRFSKLKIKAEKINLLIDYADKFKEVPPEIAVRPFPEENEVQFCEANVFVWAKMLKNNTLKFYFAVENPQGVSARALCTILDTTLSGEAPADILKVPDDFVLKIFSKDLLMGKNMSLIGIFHKVKSEAKKYLN